MFPPPDSANVTAGGVRTRVHVVAAVAANGVIGDGKRMPWHLPEDLRHFKALTFGHTVIMGRKTFESILATLGKPLPGRKNIVVSRTRGLEPAGARVVASLDAALALCSDEPVVFVIGGGQLYAAALPIADRLLLTEIKRAFPGNIRFPEFDRSQWREAQRTSQTSADGVEFDFVTYERNR